MAGKEESDQLPEEQPSEAVTEDDESGTTRDDVKDSAGVPGEDGQEGDGQATGNPKNAG